MVLGPYLYKLYDLAIHSEFELPDLSIFDAETAVTSSFPIIEIVSGKVPESLPNAFNFGWIEANPDSCIFHIRDKCRLQVNNGNQIVLDIFSAMTKQEICAYIIGCGFPTLAHMRKLIPLHMSMVESPFGALMFTGPSGAGKSTTAAVLAQQPGWKLLCDDICVLQPTDEGGSLHFGINKIKLWKNTISTLGLSGSTMERDHVRPEKYHLPVQPSKTVDVNDVCSIYKLSWAEKASVSEIKKSILFEAIMNSVHGSFLTGIFGNVDILNKSSAILSNNSHGYEIKRIKNQDSINMLQNTISATLKKLPVMAAF